MFWDRIFFKFIYLFWEKETAWTQEGQREREKRENPKQAVRTHEDEPGDHDLSWSQESDA